MLVEGKGPKGLSPSSYQVIGILESPTLARVERARLRHEEGSNRENAYLDRVAITQSLLPANFAKDASSAIKRGLLWQQRDKLFSRWKERYFILTRDYLHCFRRASGQDRISEMGQYLFKVKLVDIDSIKWENKRTYSSVVLLLGRDGKMYLRAADGLEEWYELLEECMLTGKERRRVMRHSTDSKGRDNNNISSVLDEYIAARQKLPTMRFHNVDSLNSRQGAVQKRDWTPPEDCWDNPSLDNRLSLLTDIDINSYDDDTLGTPSVTSYRLNHDILCIQPPSLREKNSGSFRSNKTSTGAIQRTNTPQRDISELPIKYRERSYSDIQQMDRKQWRIRYNHE